MHPLTFNGMKQLFHLNKASDREFMANVMGHRKEDGNRYTVEDFMPRADNISEPEGPAERLAKKIRMAAMSAGGL